MNAKPSASTIEASVQTGKSQRLGRLALETIAEALWPTRCAVCDQPGAVLCNACRKTLPFIDAWRACPACGAPFGLVQCSECNPVALASGGRKAPPLSGAASALALDDQAHRIVTAYKDHGERRLASAMAHIMARYIPPSWTAQSPESIALTHIPATTAAVRRRGFDHAELLTSELSHATGFKHEALLARPSSHDQRKLSRQRRQKNMAGRFQTLPGAFPRARPSEAVIIVDDVCTTGATLYAACDALMESGVKTVYGLTFARAY